MKTVDVVVGVVCNAQDEVLIALRPAHVVQSGLWEFPGGKVEPGESLENALIREFQEEVGITVTDSAFLLEVRKTFVEKSTILILHTFRILAFHGEPYGREKQEIRWVPKETLHHYHFPEANADIVRAVSGA